MHPVNTLPSYSRTHPAPARRPADTHPPPYSAGLRLMSWFSWFPARPPLRQHRARAAPGEKAAHLGSGRRGWGRGACR
eukprot:2606102-Rhodomonas_salina.1